MDYSQKTAIITGAANGIGLGIARQCAKEGMRLMLADIVPEKLEQAAQELAAAGAEVAYKVTDVTCDEDWKELVSRTKAEYGGIDFLYSNAGVSFNKTVATATAAEWDWIFQVNFWSHLKAYQAIAPVMSEQESGGHIIFTGSFACFASPATMVPYACTKSALLSLAEGLTHEMALIGNDKVKLSVVMPAYVSTSIQFNEAARPDTVKNLEETSNPLDRAVWSRIAENIREPSTVNGTISADLAAERIIDQVKRGYFYIYTHRNYTKALAYEKTSSMLMDRPPVNPGTFMAEYYQRKQPK